MSFCVSPKPASLRTCSGSMFFLGLAIAQSFETQLVNLGRATAQKPSCGVYPNKFVVRPLHAVSPVVGALLRLECYPVLRMRHNSQLGSRIPPSSAEPHVRARDRESSERSEKNVRSRSPALSQLAQAGIGGRARVEQQAGRVVPRLFFPVISELGDHALGQATQQVAVFQCVAVPLVAQISAMAVTADRVADGHKCFIPKGLDCVP